MRKIVMLACWVVAGAGCGVSKQVVEEQRAELGMCRAALAECETRREQLLEESTAEAAASQQRLTVLQGEVTECRDLLAEGERLREACEKLAEERAQRLEELREEVRTSRALAAAADEQAQRLRDREEELRGKMQQELNEKTVEIENQREQLSVRVADRILFSVGNDAILPRGQAVLDKLAPSLVGGVERLRVEGHTDNVPIGPSLKSRYFSNWELSAARAASVVRYLQYAHGVDPARMEAVGLAQYHPVADNDTPEGRARNRRVEIVLLQ